jgi:hypothetical protein
MKTGSRHCPKADCLRTKTNTSIAVGFILLKSPSYGGNRQYLVRIAAIAFDYGAVKAGTDLMEEPGRTGRARRVAEWSGALFFGRRHVSLGKNLAGLP